MQVHKIQEALKLSTINNFTTSDETILRQRVVLFCFAIKRKNGMTGKCEKLKRQDVEQL